MGLNERHYGSLRLNKAETAEKHMMKSSWKRLLIFLLRQWIRTMMDMRVKIAGINLSERYPTF